MGDNCNSFWQNLLSGFTCGNCPNVNFFTPIQRVVYYDDTVQGNYKLETDSTKWIINLTTPAGTPIACYIRNSVDLGGSSNISYVSGLDFNIKGKSIVFNKFILYLESTDSNGQKDVYRFTVKNEPTDEVKIGLDTNTPDTNAKLSVINADDTKNETTPVYAGAIGILEHYNGGTFESSDNKIIPTNVPGAPQFLPLGPIIVCGFGSDPAKPKVIGYIPSTA